MGDDVVTFPVKARNVDENLGTVYGERINIFAGYVLKYEMDPLLEEMKKHKNNNSTLKLISIAADENYLWAINQKDGGCRIVSICMAVVSFVAFLDTLRLLLEFIKLKEGKVGVIVQSNFFMGIVLSLLSNCIRILVFVDVTSTQGLLLFDVARPLFTFQGTLHIMGSLFTIFQWVEVIKSVKASMVYSIRSVSFIESCGTRVALLLLSSGLVVGDYYVTSSSVYGIDSGNLGTLPSAIFLLYMMSIAAFELTVLLN